MLSNRMMLVASIRFRSYCKFSFILFDEKISDEYFAYCYSDSKINFIAVSTLLFHAASSCCHFALLFHLYFADSGQASRARKPRTLADTHRKRRLHSRLFRSVESESFESWP